MLLLLWILLKWSGNGKHVCMCFWIKFNICLLLFDTHDSSWRHNFVKWIFSTTLKAKSSLFKRNPNSNHTRILTARFNHFFFVINLPIALHMIDRYEWFKISFFLFSFFALTSYYMSSILFKHHNTPKCLLNIFIT